MKRRGKRGISLRLMFDRVVATVEAKLREQVSATTRPDIRQLVESVVRTHWMRRLPNTREFAAGMRQTVSYLTRYWSVLVWAWKTCMVWYERSTLPVQGEYTTYKPPRSDVESFVNGLLARVSNCQDPAPLVWRGLMELMRMALVHNICVPLNGLAVLEPYVKQATKYRHPGTGRMQKVNEKRYVRLVLTPQLKRELAGV